MNQNAPFLSPLVKVFACLGMALSFTACADREVGSRQRPFTMYFVPHQDSDGIVLAAEGFSKAVEKYVSQSLYGEDTGFHVRTAVPVNYVAVVEAFGTKRADFATLHTFAYILAKDVKRYDIEALLTVQRGDGEGFYKGQIIARVDSGINSLQDLKGKRFAYTDPSSTSGFLLARKLFQDNNIEVGQVVFGTRHDNVVAMVYQGQVDAGATFHSTPLKEVSESGEETLRYRDARNRVVTQFPDVFDKIKIVGFTEKSPNEPWVIRRGLFKDEEKDAKIRGLIQEALLKYSKTSEGKKVLADYYDVTGVIPANDGMYEGIRKIVTESDINIEEMFQQSKG